MTRRRSRDATELVDDLIGDDPVLRRRVEEETVHSRVASLIHDARKRAGLTQAQLARLVGTTQAAISRLESADYEGHSLSTLVRIARALDNRLEITMVPSKGPRRAG